MRHPYEYKVITEYMTAWDVKKKPNFEEPLIRQRLAEALESYYFRLPSIILDELDDAEGWEVNSHSLSFVDNTVLISTLLRRSRI